MFTILSTAGALQLEPAWRNNSNSTATATDTDMHLGPWDTESRCRATARLVRLRDLRPSRRTRPRPTLRRSPLLLQYSSSQVLLPHSIPLSLFQSRLISLSLFPISPAVNQAQGSYYSGQNAGATGTSVTSYTSPAQQASSYYGYQYRGQQQPAGQQQTAAQQTSFSSYYQQHTPTASAAPAAKTTPTATPPSSHQGVGYGSSPIVAALPSVAYPTTYSTPYYSPAATANRSETVCLCVILLAQIVHYSSLMGTTGQFRVTRIKQTIRSFLLDHIMFLS